MTKQEELKQLYQRRKILEKIIESGNTNRPKEDNLSNFKAELNEILNKKAFLGVSEVLRKIENSNFDYNKAMLTNLRNGSTQQLNALMPDNFIAQIKSFIDTLN